MPAKRKERQLKREVVLSQLTQLYMLELRLKLNVNLKFTLSAYANGWLVRTYKKRGGGYR